MAIKGLLDTPLAPEVHLYRTGELNVEEEASVAVAALNELGIVDDNDKALESTIQDFNALARLGYDGRLFVRPPAHPKASFDAILGATEAKRPEIVRELYRYTKLWVPGTESESYTDEELDQPPNRLAVARLALFNTDETTGFDPLLQYLDTPFDDYAKEQRTKDTDTTQLAEVAKAIEAFEVKHPKYDLTDVDHRDFAFMALMDRIKDVPIKAMILRQGFMRMQKLGRRSIDGNSVVGGVFSDHGRLVLGRSGGSADPGSGVGVSVGLNETA